MKSPRRWMRTLLMLLLLLAGGAMINVSVAWGIANSIEPGSSDPEFISEMGPGLTSSWFILRHRTYGSLWLVAMIQLHSTDAMTIDDSRVPQWSRIKHLPAYVEGDAMPMLHDLAYGWPVLSMWYAVDAERDWQSGTVISRKTLGSVEQFGLPLWLLWPGFAINMLFYAAILWLLWVMPGKTRRFIRIKRGLCPVCAYPIGTSPVCTECGKALIFHTEPSGTRA